MKLFAEILFTAIVIIFILWYIYYVGRLIVRLFNRSVHGDSTNIKQKGK